MSASDVNAFYDQYTNSMYILAGLLNGAFYREDMSREELLSSICMSIGHEISHGFDIEGSKHDETGALRNWWTDSDLAAFERRSEKLVRYYDSLRPWKDGSTYSGALVQTEVVADMGAMACVLRMAAKTPDFDYDAFFRSNAVYWRAKYRENHVENSLKANEHPLEHLRVNVVAAQYPKFQETYNIQPGDGMYIAPEDRIAVWGMPDNTAE